VSVPEECDFWSNSSGYHKILKRDKKRTIYARDFDKFLSKTSRLSVLSSEEKINENNYE